MLTNIATNPVRLAIAAAAIVLISSVPSLSAAATAKIARDLPISLRASQEPEHSTLSQFVSAGHVLGFDGDGYFVSNGSYALRVSFDGANTTTPWSDNVVQGKTGKDTQATPLSRVSYSEVWPGIGVTYDTVGGGIARSTWTLAPGADSAAIRLRYNRPVEVLSSGGLDVRFETGTMTESRPVAWQDVDGQRRFVDVEFEVLASELVGFRVGAYQRELPLVIDPTLSWKTFLGGSGGEAAVGIAVDGSGNVYVAGEGSETWGSPVRAYGGFSDALVAKLSPSGGLIWNTFLGGSGTDWAFGIAVDGGGNVYMAGASTATWGSPVRTYSGGMDASVAKLSPSGGLIWNTFLGGSDNDIGFGITVDGSGNVYMVGQSGGTCASVAELSSSGGLIWNTLLGGSGSDFGYGIAVDGSGNVYVGGESEASCSGCGRDAFVAKLVPYPAMCGDVNGDDRITAPDALAALRVAVESGCCPIDVCDYSGDGKITVADALAILRVAVGQAVAPKCPSSLLVNELANV